MRTSSRNVVCVVFDEFELYDLAAFSQVLSAAGKQWNWKPFRLHTVGETASAKSSTTLSVARSSALEQSPQAEILFIPGGYGARLKLRQAAFIDFLRVQVEAADLVVSISQGSLLVAATGLSAGVTFALSAAHETAARTELRDFDAIDIERGPLAVSGKFVSSANSAGTLDAALYTVRQVLGDTATERVKGDLGLLQPTLRF